ncbi:uncharacterized protein PITG_08220 [Phytophthora infestans T30-4]|uniref:Uncharacterized protein n=1 Tax=Phytophthora infestans (strain T30-4) TaxID=403677 RepID=D0N9R8_PHYIT|nr:uncharacterized protein PITG_08220 [Phytophthora infestans T30-4]EEY54556.1 hypothetical protein PITG_08220 [Phytophthora infestans T30-4]|eukprot:XP_002904378.1 hypothetical protein PITG_08220 [Phytophthora infestans T30-4]
MNPTLELVLRSLTPTHKIIHCAQKTAKLSRLPETDEDRGAAVLAGGSMKTTSEETNIPYITLNAIDQIWCSEHGRFIFLLQVGVGSTHNPINRDVSSDGSDWLNPIFDLLR